MAYFLSLNDVDGFDKEFCVLFENSERMPESKNTCSVRVQFFTPNCKQFLKMLRLFQSLYKKKHVRANINQLLFFQHKLKNKGKCGGSNFWRHLIYTYLIHRHYNFTNLGLNHIRHHKFHFFNLRTLRPQQSLKM